MVQYFFDSARDTEMAPGRSVRHFNNFVTLRSVLLRQYVISHEAASHESAPLDTPTGFKSGHLK